DSYYTPPKSSGLLEGTFRSYLLKKFPKFFQEKVLKLEDLLLSKKIFVCNSLREIVKVKEVKLEYDLY
ncbi:MAG: aminotransferase class IV, partial [Leptospiraceae bacterium]|nr:aminotransferase class IV [Leptospiraceae bacterium]